MSGASSDQNPSDQAPIPFLGLMQAKQTTEETRKPKRARKCLFERDNKDIRQAPLAFGKLPDLDAPQFLQEQPRQTAGQHEQEQAQQQDQEREQAQEEQQAQPEQEQQKQAQQQGHDASGNDMPSKSESDQNSSATDFEPHAIAANLQDIFKQLAAVTPEVLGCIQSWKRNCF